MTEMDREQASRSVAGTEQADSSPARPQKQQPSPMNLPAIAASQASFNLALTVPEIKPLGHDRRSLREANEAQREMQRISVLTIKAGLALESVRTVNTFAAHCFDVGQDEIMGIYYGRDRYQDTSEVAAQVMGQRIHAMGTQQAAVIDLYFKRLASEF